MTATATVQMPALLTAEEFFERAPDVPCELVRGEVIYLSPAGGRHGVIAGQLSAYLTTFIREHGLGKGFAAETGFILTRSPDTVRAPDFAFVSSARLPAGGIPDGFFPVAPDLAVEVVSPSDSWVAVEEKVFEYLSADTREVWVVNPKLETVQVCKSTGRHMVTKNEILTSELFPGLHLPLSQVFG